MATIAIRTNIIQLTLLSSLFVCFVNSSAVFAQLLTTFSKGLKVSEGIKGNCLKSIKLVAATQIGHSYPPADYVKIVIPSIITLDSIQEINNQIYKNEAANNLVFKSMLNEALNAKNQNIKNGTKVKIVMVSFLRQRSTQAEPDVETTAYLAMLVSFNERFCSIESTVLLKQL